MIVTMVPRVCKSRATPTTARKACARRGIGLHREIDACSELTFDFEAIQTVRREGDPTLCCLA